MTKLLGDPTPEKGRFASDEPIRDLVSKDLFGHRAYSEALAKAVLEATPPFTIGVFGSWGEGKTSITKDYLKSALARAGGDRVAYAYFDAWKYEGDSLRRQFLRDIGKQLENSKALSSKYKLEDELEDLRSDVHDTIDNGLRFSWGRLLVVLIRAAITLVVVLAVIQLSSSFKQASMADQLVIALLSAAVVGVSGELRQTIIVGQSGRVRHSLDSPELFEQKFVQLMNAVKRKKVVIVVDNLDRCSPDRVIEILGTIKTFLEPSKASPQPIFVIPCDQEAIRKHLTVRTGFDATTANEFLRKFFNATLRINPFLEEDIRDYVYSELNNLKLSVGLPADSARELVQLITTAFRANPRRVKQFLNTLSAKLLLIHEREEDGTITPRISGEVPFIAKLTVIEEEFPDFYDAIQEDVRAFNLVSQAAIGFGIVVPERLKKYSSDVELRAFLRGTRRTVSVNVRAFTRLRLTSQERQLPEYWTMRNALVDGRIEEVANLLADLSEGEIANYAGAAVVILKEELHNRYLEAALNVVDAFVQVPTLAESIGVTEVFEQLYADSELRILLRTLAPAKTLALLGTMKSDAARRLIDTYIDLLKGDYLHSVFSDDEVIRWQSQAALGLSAIRESLSATQQDQIRTVIVSPELLKNVEAIEAFGSSTEGAEAFLGPEAFAAAAARLNREALATNESGSLLPVGIVKILLNAERVAGERGMDSLVNRATRLLAEVAGDSQLAGLEGVLILLGEFNSSLDQVESVRADQLIEQILGVIDLIPSNRRWKVCVICAALYEKLSANFQEHARNLTIQSAVKDAIADVESYVDYEVKRSHAAGPRPLLEVLIASLKERFRGSADVKTCEDIASLFILHKSTFGDEEVADLFFQAIDERNMLALSAALSSQRSRIADELRVVGDRVAERLVAAVPTLPIGEQISSVNILGQIGEHVTIDQRKSLRDHVVILMQSEDTPTRSTGVDLLSHGQKAHLLRSDERRYISEKVLLWLLGRVDSIDLSYAPVFDRLVADAELLPPSSLGNLVEVLMQLLTRVPALAPTSAQNLARLPLITKRRNEVLEELLRVSKQESDTDRRHSLLRSAYKLAKESPRSRGAKAVLSYFEELLKGSPEDATFALELFG